MDNRIERLLALEIEGTMQDLVGLDASSEEAKTALRKLCQLQDERVKELDALLKNRAQDEATSLKMKELELRETELKQKREQLDAEIALRMDECAVREKEALQRQKQAEAEAALRGQELAQKEQELKEAKRTRRWKTVIDAAAIVVPIGVGVYEFNRGLKFEEEGKVYSSRTPGFISGIMRLFRK